MGISHPSDLLTYGANAMFERADLEAFPSGNKTPLKRIGSGQLT
jgi:hypothetical protein